MSRNRLGDPQAIERTLTNHLTVEEEIRSAIFNCLSSFPFPDNIPCKNSWDLLIDSPHSSCFWSFTGKCDWIYLLPLLTFTILNVRLFKFNLPCWIRLKYFSLEFYSLTSLIVIYLVECDWNSYFLNFVPFGLLYMLSLRVEIISLLRFHHHEILYTFTIKFPD